MCTYNITIDDGLVKQVEKHLLQGITIQEWLQQQVNQLLSSSMKRRRGTMRHRLTDEQLAEELKDFPPLTDSDFPELTREDYNAAIRTH